MAESYFNGTKISGTANFAVYAMAFLELGTLIPTIPIMAFCSSIVYKTSILHRNLKGILLAQLFGTMMNLWPRAFVLIDQIFVAKNNFLSVPKFISGPSTAAFTFNNMAGHVLIVERICATVYVDTYESYRSWAFTVVWLSITIILCLALTIYHALVLDSLFSLTNISVGLYIGAMIASLIEIFIFSMIKKFNKKLFDLRHGNGKNQQLSVRYQLNENIRTGRQLAPNFLCHFITVFITFVMTMNFQFGIITKAENMLLFLGFLFLAHAFNGLALPVAMLCYHPLLNRKAKASLAIIKKSLRNSSAVSPYEEKAQPLDTDGRPFGERIQQENEDKDAYFKQLASAWGDRP
ncbi:hypothetical protein niasHS_004552 [Heterodera schachtii]|uniref:Gustatory receptor n=1 Tax=Heterodera schachtii TaxID=97005 RepID=A0ABD2JV64_HETSC